MQIYSISNTQNNKQNFGVIPELYGHSKALITRKLTKNNLDEVFKLFEETNLKTPHLKTICFTADREKLNAFITADLADRQDLGQRLFESTYHFIQRVCNRAVKTDDKVTAILEKEHVLDKFIK